MVSAGSFGIDTPGTDNIISRNTNQTADVAVLSNSEGQKLEGTSFGSETSVSEEKYAGVALPTLTADDAQNGAAIIVADAINESSTDYAKITTETRNYPGAAS